MSIVSGCLHNIRDIPSAFHNNYDKCDPEGFCLHGCFQGQNIFESFISAQRHCCESKMLLHSSEQSTVPVRPAIKPADNGCVVCLAHVDLPIPTNHPSPETPFCQVYSASLAIFLLNKPQDFLLVFLFLSISENFILLNMLGTIT